MAQNEIIFLLEALVYKIVLFENTFKTNKDFKIRVSISFASLDPLEICEDDCLLDIPNTDPFTKYFNCGKSYMFSMTESEITQAMSKCPVKVIVEKTLPCGCLPTQVIMGETNIDMTKEFIQARKAFLSEPFNISSQFLKDFFRIILADGTEVGKILLFLRISCFGKNIISKFLGEQNNNILNLGNKSVIDRSCKPKKDFETEADLCGCRSVRELRDPAKLQQITRIISSKDISKENNTVTTETNFDQVNCVNTIPSNISIFRNFENEEIFTYVALIDTNFTPYFKNSYSQATAFLNKCLQVKRELSDCSSNSLKNIYYNCMPFSDDTSICTSSILLQDDNNVDFWNKTEHPDVYFFGMNNSSKSNSKSKSVASQSTKKPCKGPCAKKTVVGNASIQTQSSATNTGAQTNKKNCGANVCTSTGKAVSINEERCPRDKPCPYKAQEMQATVSHIKIGPREPCVVHGFQPCPGQKSPEDRADIKMSSTNNPRRGVFELVIRRLNGAPLAKNELMLEWTPPTPKPIPCGVSPCIIQVPCKSKCKMVVCKPVICKPPKCKPKCFKVPCSSSCGIPCRKCCKVSLPPCRSCNRKCAIPCDSSPCLKLCPVGRRKQKASSKQPPKVKPHRKLVSPCRNRSQTCPVVKCRSVPGPCGTPCPLPKCCSTVPCAQPVKCCSISHSCCMNS